MKIFLFFILFSSLIFGQEITTMTKLQELTNKIDSLINVNLNKKVDSITVKNLIRDYMNEVFSETSDFTLSQIDESIYYMRNLINLGYQTSIYNIEDIDKSVTDIRNKIWLNGEGIPPDSTGLSTGQLYYNRTGNIKRKF